MRLLLRRLLFAAVLLLAGAWPVYYVAANVWIRPGGGLERLLNRRPQALQITWRSARTTWPGRVEVEGFSLRSQVPSVQWWVALDHGRATIDLPALLRRELVIRDLTGSGVRTRVARRLDARLRFRPDPALQPVIPGLSNPPRVAPERAYPRRRKPPRQPWRIALSGIDLSGVREVWIVEYRFTGDATVTGGLDLTMRRSLRLYPSTARIRTGTLHRGARAILTRARGTATARILDLDPRRIKGRAVLGWTVGRAQIAGSVGDLAVLRDLVSGARWIDLRGSGGPLSADVRLDRGRFLAGSRVEARPGSTGIGFLDYTATGRGRVVWSVEAEPGGETTGQLRVAFDRYEVRRQGASRPHVAGRGLTLVAKSAAPRADRLFVPVAVDLQMPDAQVPDLAYYNAYLPARTGLSLTGGAGRMSGRFRAAAPRWIGSGEVHLSGRRIAAALDGRRLTGDLRLDALLGHADVREKIFDLAGSKLEVTGVDLAALPEGASGTGGLVAAPGWWGRFHVERGLLLPGRPVFLTGRVEAMLRDPKPLVALFAPERTAKLLGKAGRLLDIQGVGATADVRLGEALMEVDHLAVAGGPAELRGRLRFAGADRRGVLLARYGRLSVGLELAGGERQIHLLHPRRWFEERLTAGR